VAFLTGRKGTKNEIQFCFIPLPTSTSSHVASRLTQNLMRHSPKE